MDVLRWGITLRIIIGVRGVYITGVCRGFPQALESFNNEIDKSGMSGV